MGPVELELVVVVVVVALEEEEEAGVEEIPEAVGERGRERTPTLQLLRPLRLLLPLLETTLPFTVTKV